MPALKFYHLVPVLLFLTFQEINAQIKLDQNSGNKLIETGMPPCEEDETWGRIFTLADFGVTTNEQFLVKSIEVGISKSYNGANLQYGVYSVDSNFPASDPVLLGTGGYGLLPRIDSPQVIHFDLEQPIVVPSGVERIMIGIGKSVDYYNPNSAEVVISGTEEAIGESWYLGCRKYYSFVSTNDLEVPLPDANFYINATGETFNTVNSGATTTLSHSVCDDLFNPMTTGCSYGGMAWSRDFILTDFGISQDEEFIIDSGQVGISYIGWGVTFEFRIYKIDDNFPASFSDTNLIGSSQVVPVFYWSNSVGAAPKILNVEFDNPVVVPKEVKRILVEVYQTHDVSFPAATRQDDGSTSWYRSYAGGCTPYGEFKDIKDLGWPETKLYITVTGQSTKANIPFSMKIVNNCSDLLKKFSLTNASEVSSIKWNFGDPASGAGNHSTAFAPSHDFSNDGTYTITATITAKNGNIEVVEETIDVKEPPKAYPVNNIEACEDFFGTGISSSFDTSKIQSQVLKNQTEKLVTHIDGSGNKYDILPNPFTNSVKHRETIKVRVAWKDEPCCYAETTFDLIVNPLPNLSSVEDIFVCDNENDGYSTFDLTKINSELLTGHTSVNFYHQNGGKISNSHLDKVINKIEDQEKLTVRVTNTITGCYNEAEFKIAVTHPPIAYTLQALTGCDDNYDGISENFDTSEIEKTVLRNQTGMEISYYTETGNKLSGPLPNPYTNSKANEEIITVRVSDPKTGCYSETSLHLQTSSQPQINKPATLYACDMGNGTAIFDTSAVEKQLIGNQHGLQIFYFDENKNPLPSPLPLEYQNMQPGEETIFIRVENKANSMCFSETSLDLIVNHLPEITLQNNYFLCDLEPLLYVATNSNFDSYLWTFEDGNVISSSFDANLVDAGTYTLQVTTTKNNVSCENSFTFNLIRSVLPQIEEIKVQDISASNYIVIISSGDGDFEYSIDGINFQEDNTFYNLSGGIYNVQVRDINGCGLDSQEVVLIDYPRFLTPNEDGFNDLWQIKGISKFPDSKTQIFDRYGKLLQVLSSESNGWDGSFNGSEMPTDDYWFMLYLSDGRTVKGHFSLVR